MWETYFGFKKTSFSDCPDSKQLFASQAWNQVKARLQFLVDHQAAGLLTGEVGSGKSTAARTFTATLNPSLYKILYLHWSSGSCLDLWGSFGCCARATCDCWSRSRAHGGRSATGSTRYADGKRSRSSSAWKRHTT
jgi:energy-coupling factor transporter ATP-binding protein EcfA2